MGRTLATSSIVPEYAHPQLGRLVVTPFATIGVLSAVLVWEIEHVGSVLLALGIATVAIGVGVFVARRLRRDIERLSDYYETLLRTADEQSRQAEVANRVKDEFLATLSHELRTPLNSVLGWSRLLATGKLDATQTTKAIQAIERAGWAQSRLIEDLLDISRIVSGNMRLAPQATTVQPLIEAAVDSLRPAAYAKQISLELDLDPSIGAVSADPDRLQQVVWNLVSNAIKFTESGGTVNLRLAQEHGVMRISVRDTGIGFSPEVAAHLFERFRQGDSSSTRQYGGLGLGLGIVRHVVELHGGTVTASSGGENAGSVFDVRLPIRTPEASGPGVPGVIEAPSPIAHAPSLRGVSVLAVDDDPESRDFVRSTLEQYGAVVVTASSTREARDRFRREPTDIVISDLLMPQEDGVELIRQIRELDTRRGRHTPAVALTALARADDRRRTLGAGYQLHITKPVDPMELVSTVERLAQEGRGTALADN